jgi:tRNA (mo5U34)-methyltransferase
MGTARSVEQQIASLAPWFHNLHLPDGTQTAPGHPYGDFPSFKWQHLATAVPHDLAGWTVLDIGCNAGFYSIELARRGAQVLGMDVERLYLDQARWAARQYSFHDRLAFIEGDVYELLNSSARYDLVWFTGVFYHLRYPTLALDLVRRSTARLMVFQSMTMPGEVDSNVPPDLPLHQRERMLQDSWPKMAFIEHRVAGDASNWWAPNPAGVEALLRSAGFKVVARPEHEFYFCEPVAIPQDADKDLARLRNVASRGSTCVD